MIAHSQQEAQSVKRVPLSGFKDQNFEKIMFKMSSGKNLVVKTYRKKCFIDLSQPRSLEVRLCLIKMLIFHYLTAPRWETGGRIWLRFAIKPKPLPLYSRSCGEALKEEELYVSTSISSLEWRSSLLSPPKAHNRLTRIRDTANDPTVIREIWKQFFDGTVLQRGSSLCAAS